MCLYMCTCLSLHAHASQAEAITAEANDRRSGVRLADLTQQHHGRECGCGRRTS